MDKTAPAPLDLPTREALEKLADIAMPAPMPYLPQTWGWAALAMIVMAIIGWLAWRAIRRHRANRYRREALAELNALERQLGENSRRPEALAGMAALLKRVALAAWPRPEVAALSGPAWAEFVRSHSGGADVGPALRLLDDLEYRGGLSNLSLPESRQTAAAVHAWIEGHHVPA